MEMTFSHLALFILLFLRVSSAIVIAPIFGHGVVPVQVKVGFSLFLALVLYPVLGNQAATIDLRLLPLALLAIQEVLTGLAIGFALMLLFSGVRAAGEVIAYELGISVSFTADPETMQGAVLAQFFYLLAALVFFLLNGHHFVIEAIRYSYVNVPIGGISLTQGVVDLLISMTAMVFVVAVKIAAPVLVASFLVNVAISILSRVAPQINVFLLSFPLKLGVGSLVLIATVPIVVYVFKKLLLGFEQDVLQLITRL